MSKCHIVGNYMSRLIWNQNQTLSLPSPKSVNDLQSDIEVDPVVVVILLDGQAVHS